MRKALAVLMLASVAIVGPISAAQSLEDDYHAALAGYFEVDPEVIEDLGNIEIAIDEMPVALLIARHAKTSPATIAHLRERGDSWLSILRSRTLDVGLLYIMVAADVTSKTYAPLLQRFEETPEELQAKYESLHG